MSLPYYEDRHVRGCGYSCHIHGRAPVEGHGQVEEKDLYFRARFDHWTFTVSLTAGIVAGALNAPDTDGLFSDGNYQGFELGGDYGDQGGFAASWMPCDVADAIIRDCVRKFCCAIHNVDANCRSWSS